MCSSARNTTIPMSRAPIEPGKGAHERARATNCGSAISSTSATKTRSSAAACAVRSSRREYRWYAWKKRVLYRRDQTAPGDQAEAARAAALAELLWRARFQNCSASYRRRAEGLRRDRRRQRVFAAHRSAPTASTAVWKQAASVTRNPSTASARPPGAAAASRARRDDRRPYLRLTPGSSRAVELARECEAGIDGSRRRPERGAGARLHFCRRVAQSCEMNLLWSPRRCEQMAARLQLGAAPRRPRRPRTTCPRSYYICSVSSGARRRGLEFVRDDGDVGEIFVLARAGRDRSFAAWSAGESAHWCVR